MWAMIFSGCALAVGVGLLAGDLGMIQGALVAGVGSALVVPFVARLWRDPDRDSRWENDTDCRPLPGNPAYRDYQKHLQRKRDRQ